MFKYKVISFILLTAVLISGEAYCQQETQDQKVRFISGTVINVDAEGWVVNVRTDNGKMLFYIDAESDLYRFTHHMASIEIAKDDPVTIQYVVSSSGRNSIIKLVDSKPASE